MAVALDVFLSPEMLKFRKVPEGFWKFSRKSNKPAFHGCMFRKVPEGFRKSYRKWIWCKTEKTNCFGVFCYSLRGRLMEGPVVPAGVQESDLSEDARKFRLEAQSFRPRALYNMVVPEGGENNHIYIIYIIYYYII